MQLAHLPEDHALMTNLPCIPLVDVRAGGPVRHAIDRREGARALRDTCVNSFPAGSGRLVPVLDALARGWLMRSLSPYVDEVKTIAETLGFPGVWFLNGSYQWCCTALAREEDKLPWLARTLDWPFPGLGRHVEIARMQGPAGEFFNITWPGFVGALTAMAPGRFAAAINQAPLWRRTRAPWLRPVDIVTNAVTTFVHVRQIPPDQLLRDVFETCRTFGEARHRLETTRLARPVIYTLVGCEPGERCLIERSEDGVVTHEEETAAANDWLRGALPWEARVAGGQTFTCSSAQAADNSRVRREALNNWTGCFAQDSFGWVVPPVLNRYTRVAVEMCPATGTLRTVGYERVPGFDLPQPVTLPHEITAARVAA
jgi:hypothetical protein